MDTPLLPTKPSAEDLRNAIIHDLERYDTFGKTGRSTLLPIEEEPSKVTNDSEPDEHAAIQRRLVRNINNLIEKVGEAYKSYKTHHLHFLYSSIGIVIFLIILDNLRDFLLPPKEDPTKPKPEPLADTTILIIFFSVFIPCSTLIVGMHWRVVHGCRHVTTGLERILKTVENGGEVAQANVGGVFEGWRYRAVPWQYVNLENDGISRANGNNV